VISTDLYLTTHNIHERHTSMFPTGFDAAVAESERQQIDALDRGH
jgi:hypothetical protein